MTVTLQGHTLMLSWSGCMSCARPLSCWFNLEHTHSGAATEAGGGGRSELQRLMEVWFCY